MPACKYYLYSPCPACVCDRSVCIYNMNECIVIDAYRHAKDKGERENVTFKKWSAAGWSRWHAMHACSKQSTVNVSDRSIWTPIDGQRPTNDTSPSLVPSSCSSCSCCILHPVSCILYPASCILYPVSCTEHRFSWREAKGSFQIQFLPRTPVFGVEHRTRVSRACMCSCVPCARRYALYQSQIQDSKVKCSSRSAYWNVAY